MAYSISRSKFQVLQLKQAQLMFFPRQVKERFRQVDDTLHDSCYKRHHKMPSTSLPVLSQEPGLAITLSQEQLSSPKSIFKLFITDDLLELAYRQTTLYWIQHNCCFGTWWIRLAFGSSEICGAGNMDWHCCFQLLPPICICDLLFVWWICLQHAAGIEYDVTDSIQAVIEKVVPCALADRR